MGKPDALSRRFELVEGTKVKEQEERILIGEDKWDFESFKLMEMEVEEEVEELEENEEKRLEFIPEEAQMKILKLVHDDPFSRTLWEKEDL
jgi:hypothetical protein